MAANTIPTIMQMSHAGKNDPRMLKDGARPQPLKRLRPTSAASDVADFRENCTDPSSLSDPESFTIVSITALPSAAAPESDRPSGRPGLTPAATAAFAPE